MFYAFTEGSKLADVDEQGRNLLFYFTKKIWKRGEIHFLLLGTTERYPVGLATATTGYHE